MSRLAVVDPAVATGKSKELLQAVQAKLKVTPNMTKVMANSPAVLGAYLAFTGALAEGSLNAKLREEIALAVGQSNSCGYCVSAHTTLGKMAGLTEDELLASRKGESASSRTAAALRFAKEIVENRGEVSTGSLDALRSAGYSDGEIAEIVANTALNIFTNYFNQVAGTEIDFPVVKLSAASAR